MICFYKIPEDIQINRAKEERELARKVLLSALKNEYNLEKLPDIARDANGKPYFTDERRIHFNYSHCKTGILCGVGKSPVGVDAEGRRSFLRGFAGHICHPSEMKALEQSEDRDRTLLTLWVAKEAYLKFLGTGIRCDLRRLDMSAILLKEEIIVGGAYLRRWHKEGMFMCACSADRENLLLYEIKKI